MRRCRRCRINHQQIDVYTRSFVSSSKLNIATTQHKSPTTPINHHQRYTPNGTQAIFNFTHSFAPCMKHIYVYVVMCGSCFFSLAQFKRYCAACRSTLIHITVLVAYCFRKLIKERLVSVYTQSAPSIQNICYIYDYDVSFFVILFALVETN